MIAAMRVNAAAAPLLVAFHTEVMRAPSALSAGERELIAASSQPKKGWRANFRPRLSGYGRCWRSRAS
jgi:hypothetical protein